MALVRVCLYLSILLLFAPSTVVAQGRTDVVTLSNGDRMTGEILDLARGRLELKTDNAGTIYFEWDNVQSLVSTRQFELELSDGRRFLGSIGGGANNQLQIGTISGPVNLPMFEIIRVAPIGGTFWRRLDGSFDSGFSYTKSSDIAQFNFNSVTTFRRPAFEAQVIANATLTHQESDEADEADDRAYLSLAYRRFRWRQWFIGAGGSFETNESLGLQLRSQVGGMAGRIFLNTNHSQLFLSGGLVVNEEVAINSPARENLEGLVTLQTSHYTYDNLATTFDSSISYFPSLSDWGRQRLQINASIKQDIWKNLYVSANGYDSFDSDPPDDNADKNDVGVVISVGWTY